MYNGIGYQHYKGADRIKEMYKQFSGMDKDAEILKENLIEQSVRRVACFSRKSPEKVKSILLDEDYQGED